MKNQTSNVLLAVGLLFAWAWAAYAGEPEKSDNSVQHLTVRGKETLAGDAELLAAAKRLESAWNESKADGLEKCAADLVKLSEKKETALRRHYEGLARSFLSSSTSGDLQPAGCWQSASPRWRSRPPSGFATRAPIGATAGSPPSCWLPLRVTACST